MRIKCIIIVNTELQRFLGERCIMKSKRIDSISGLPEESFFNEVSLRYEKILKNALQLDDDADCLTELSFATME